MDFFHHHDPYWDGQKWVKLGSVSSARTSECKTSQSDLKSLLDPFYDKVKQQEFGVCFF